MSELFAQRVPDDVLRLIDEIVPILFENDPARFIETTYIPMDGAEHSIVSFRLSPGKLYAEFCAAVRAKGLEIPDGFHEIRSLAGVATPG
jgi:hypothetical protein